MTWAYSDTQEMDDGGLQDVQGMTGCTGDDGGLEDVQGMTGDYRVYRGWRGITGCTGDDGVLQGVPGMMGDYRMYRGLRGITGSTGDDVGFRIYRGCTNVMTEGAQRMAGVGTWVFRARAWIIYEKYIETSKLDCDQKAFSKRSSFAYVLLNRLFIFCSLSVF